jgi:hydroxyacylglutathione hydrolase
MNVYRYMESSTELILFQSSLYQTNSALVITGDSVIAVDANWLPAEVEKIAYAFENYAKARESYAIYTHSDYDHIIAHGRLNPQKVICSALFLSSARKAKAIGDALDFDEKHYLQRNYTISFPSPDWAINADSTTLHIGNEIIIFYLSPGHTSDGIFTIFAKSGLFFAGDYFSDIEIPIIEDDIEKYRHSILKAREIIKKHDIKILIPGHGSIAKNQGEMLHRVDLALEYLDILTGRSAKSIDLFLSQLPFSAANLEYHKENLKRWVNA